MDANQLSGRQKYQRNAYKPYMKGGNQYEIPEWESHPKLHHHNLLHTQIQQNEATMNDTK